MPVKIGKDIVIYDDMVFQVGYGTPEEAQNGMIRYNPEASDFEFYIADRWARSGAKLHPLYDMIRYNEELKDYQFLIEGVWVHRCSGMCPTHERCDPCEEIEECEDPEICPPCPGFLLDDPDYVRYYTLEYEGRWHRDVFGSEGLYIDYWDLSLVPHGAQIDFRYQAYIIPDRFLVLHPYENLIFDSGWVSSEPNHILNKREEYQFTISHPGNDTIRHLITKQDSSELRVVIFGSENGLTEWNYSLRYIYKDKYKIMVRFHPADVRFLATWGINDVGGAYVHEEVAFDIPEGRSRLHFTHVEGWEAPYSLDVFLTEGLPDYLLIVDVYYTVAATKLHVLIEPKEARFYARWKIADAFNTYAHDEIIDIEQGEYILKPLPAYGWTSPADVNLNITSTGTVTIILTYIREFSDLTVIIEPDEMKSVATWDVSVQSGILSTAELAAIEDASPFTDGQTVQVPYGLHDVIPSNHFGWVTPIIPAIHIEDGENVTVIAEYDLLCTSIRVTVHPHDVHGSATWTISKHSTAIPSDGILTSPFGHCNTETPASGPYIHNKIISVPYGKYDIVANDVIGWIAPTLPPIHIGSSTTRTVPLVYTKEMSHLHVIIEPDGLAAEWMVDGYTGILTGNKIIPLQTGTYTVIPYDKTGYITPPIVVDFELPTTETEVLILHYELMLITLTVLIEPETVRDTAEWTIDTVGGVYGHGDEVSITVGNHYVTPGNITGMTHSGTEHVEVDTNEDKTITIYYTDISVMVEVEIFPESIRPIAQWYLDFDPATLLNSGNQRSAPFGEYTVHGTDAFPYMPATPLPYNNITSPEPNIHFHELHYELLESTVTVNIIPGTAVANGAQWKIGEDMGFRNSGDSLSFAAGTYQLIGKEPIAGHSAPAPVMIDIAGDGPETYTIEYELSESNVTVTILPEGARDAGARWKLDEVHGWQNSDDSIILTAGTYTLTADDATGYDKPAPETVTVLGTGTENFTLTYDVAGGTLQVFISPDDIGAKWKFESESTEYNSGDTYPDVLAPATYTVHGTEVTGYEEPSNDVTIVAGATTETTLLYGGIGCDMEPFNGNANVKAMPIAIGSSKTYIRIFFEPMSVPDRICIYDGDHTGEKYLTNIYIINGYDLTELGLPLLYDSGWQGRSFTADTETDWFGNSRFPHVERTENDWAANLDADDDPADYVSDTGGTYTGHFVYINTSNWPDTPKTIVVFGHPSGGTSWKIYDIKCYTDPVPPEYECHSPLSARPPSGTTTPTTSTTSRGCFTVTITPTGFGAQWFAPGLTGPTAVFDPNQPWDSGDTICGVDTTTFTIVGEEIAGYEIPTCDVTVVEGNIDDGPIAECVLHYEETAAELEIMDCFFHASDDIITGDVSDAHPNIGEPREGSCNLLFDGEYASTSDALPDVVDDSGTFDAFAIGPGTSVKFWSEPNFTGTVLLEATGPALYYTSGIFGVTYYDNMNLLGTEYPNETLQAMFPPSVRHAAPSLMADWKSGSFKVWCDTSSSSSFTSVETVNFANTETTCPTGDDPTMEFKAAFLWFEVEIDGVVTEWTDAAYDPDIHITLINSYTSCTSYDQFRSMALYGNERNGVALPLGEYEIRPDDTMAPDYTLTSTVPLTIVVDDIGEIYSLRIKYST